jgi:hypothetical protein
MSHVRLVAFATLLALAASPLLAAENQPHKADWLHRAKWGVMYHYTSGWKKNAGDIKVWNKLLAEFDVAGLAKQLKSVGVGYFLITARHGGPHPLAPNSVHERAHPESVVKRDLVLHLADELAKHDLRLMLYFATGMGIKKPTVAEHSAAMIKEYSLRYKDKVAGWWFDNNCGDRTLQKLIVDAARAGNAETLIAFSPPKMPKKNTPWDDYTAGNTHAPGYARCNGRLVDGAQWHMLTYLGRNWGGYCRNPHGRWPVEKVAHFAKKFASRGGATTWDTPHQDNGLITDHYLAYLKAIGKATGTLPK